MNGIVIYEKSIPNSNSTEYALPLSTLEFEINPDMIDEKWKMHRIIET